MNAAMSGVDGVCARRIAAEENREYILQTDVQEPGAKPPQGAGPASASQGPAVAHGVDSRAAGGTQSVGNAQSGPGSGIGSGPTGEAPGGGVGSEVATLPGPIDISFEVPIETGGGAAQNGAMCLQPLMCDIVKEAFFSTSN